MHRQHGITATSTLCESQADEVVCYVGAVVLIEFYSE